MPRGEVWRCPSFSVDILCSTPKPDARVPIGVGVQENLPQRPDRAKTSDCGLANLFREHERK